MPEITIKKLFLIVPYAKWWNARRFNFNPHLGTSNVLLVFDESEVRKIIVDCKKVLDYLAVSEVIETLEDLVQFVKDMSPCLSKVSA